MRVDTRKNIPKENDYGNKLNNYFTNFFPSKTEIPKSSIWLATHDFVAEPEVKRLGLRLEDSSKFKAVNSATREVQGTTKQVPIKRASPKEQYRKNLLPLEAKGYVSYVA